MVAVGWTMCSSNCCSSSVVFGCHQPADDGGPTLRFVRLHPAAQLNPSVFHTRVLLLPLVNVC